MSPSSQTVITDRRKGVCVADYFRVEPRFWSGPTGRQIKKLGYEARILATYLLTGPAASPFGVYYMPFPTMIHETGIPEDACAKAIADLRAIGFADYHEVDEVVWIPEMARIQIGESLAAGDKRIKWVQKEVDALAGLPFYDQFLERYAEAYLLKRKAVKPLGRGIEGASEKNSETGSPIEANPTQPIPTATAIKPQSHTQAPPVACVSDSEIRKRWEAAMLGLGLDVGYGELGLFVPETLFRRSGSDDEVRSVAAFYVAGLSANARPSPKRFIEEYPTRLAQWKASRKPAGAKLWCPRHPGIALDGRGNCSNCIRQQEVTA